MKAVAGSQLPVFFDSCILLGLPASRRLSAALRQVLLTTDNGNWQLPAYCLNPIQLSETTSEFPGFCGSYFTEVGSPSRQECRLIHWRR